MGPRTVGVLLALAVLLTGYFYLFERDAPEWDEPVGPAFRGLEFADIEEIELLPGTLARAAAAGAHPILIRKKRSEDRTEWWIEKPAVAAHLPRVESIVWSLVELQRIADVPPAEAPGVFDPAGPELAARFRTRSGEEHRVEVGRDHPEPSLELTYVRVDGERLFLTRKSFRKNLNSSLDDLRSRALFPVPEARAVRLEVLGDAKYEKSLRREGETGDWRFESPEPAPAGREAIAHVIGELNSWRAETFVRDEPGDLAPFGLAEPRTTIALTDRLGRRFALQVGSPAPGKGQVYVKWADRPFVMTAVSGPAETLERPPENLYSPFVIQLGAEEVVELVVRRPDPAPGGSFTLRRSDGGLPAPGKGPGKEPAKRPAGGPVKGEKPPGSGTWVVEEAGGNRYPADLERTRTVIEGLSHLPVKRYLPARSEAGPLNGLAQPILDLEVLSDRGSRRLSFGRPVSPEEASERISYIGVEGEPFIFQVITALVEDLGAGGMRFRNRSIPGPAPGDLEEFEVAYRAPGRERAWTVGRPGETWRLSDEASLREDRSLHANLVQSVVRKLGKEEFRADVWAPGETDFAAREIADDRFRYRVWLTRVEGEKPAFQRLYIGGEARGSGLGGGYWARVDAPDLKDLPFILDLATAQAIIDLVSHLDDITDGK